MERNATKTMDSRVPISKEAVLEMFARLPRPVQVGILSTMAVMQADWDAEHKTS